MPGEYPLHSPHGVPDAGLYRLRCYPGCCGGEHNRNANSYTDYDRYYCSPNHHRNHRYTDYDRYYCSPNHYCYHRYTDYDHYYCSSNHCCYHCYTDYDHYYCSSNHYCYHCYTDYDRYYGYPTGCLIFGIPHIRYSTSHRAV